MRLFKSKPETLLETPESDVVEPVTRAPYTPKLPWVIEERGPDRPNVAKLSVDWLPEGFGSPTFEVRPLASLRDETLWMATFTVIPEERIIQEMGCGWLDVEHAFILRYFGPEVANKILKFRKMVYESADRAVEVCEDIYHLMSQEYLTTLNTIRSANSQLATLLGSGFCEPTPYEG